MSAIEMYADERQRESFFGSSPDAPERKSIFDPTLVWNSGVADGNKRWLRTDDVDKAYFSLTIYHHSDTFIAIFPHCQLSTDPNKTLCVPYADSYTSRNFMTTLGVIYVVLIIIYWSY